MQPTLLTGDDLDAVRKAGDWIRQGRLVAFPTETVYGLGADATSNQAVARIFDAKGRPQFNPLIVHLLSGTSALAFADVPAAAQKLIDAFWPGPLTLVLKRHPACRLSPLVSAGLDTVALRAPAHEIAREILAAAERPIAAPSANRSGRISPTTANHVLDGLSGKVDMIVDGGACRLGIESTIVHVDGDRLTLLRPGSITVSMIEEATGLDLQSRTSGKITAPGQLESHYAPEASIRLEASEALDGEFLIGFGETSGDISLSASGDLVEAAANLFASLREADASGADRIAIAAVPENGIGIAINDRLRRAAAPKAD